MKLTTSAFAKVIVLAAALPMTSLYLQAAEPAAMPMNHAAMAETKVSHGMGVVEAIDTKAGTVTLKHEAIAELNWPAMTMPFKVSGSAAANVSVGQKVMFELSGEGNAMTITKMEKAD